MPRTADPDGFTARLRRSGRDLRDCLRRRNADARCPGVPAAQRRIRSERRQRWGRAAPAGAA